MRYSKSSILSIALAMSLSGSAAAQNSTNDFPWRAKAKSTVTAASKTVSSATTSVKSVHQRVASSFATPAITTPVRDLQRVTSNAVTSSSIESMPDEFFDQGKRYIRQGDTYIESSTLGKMSSATSSFASQSYSPQIPQAPSKTSLLEKAKGVGSRLNPFSMKMRRSSGYEAKDWKVPSFSDSISGISNRDSDPITFAAIKPLPAKTAQPSTIDQTQSIYAADEGYRPKKALASRTNQFTSALPTGTSITSVVPELPKSANLPALNTGAITSKSAAISKTAEISKTVKDFSPQEFIPKNFGTEISSASSSGTPVQAPAISVFEKTPIVAPQRSASLTADQQFWTPRR